MFIKGIKNYDNGFFNEAGNKNEKMDIPWVHWGSDTGIRCRGDFFK